MPSGWSIGMGSWIFFRRDICRCNLGTTESRTSRRLDRKKQGSHTDNKYCISISIIIFCRPSWQCIRYIRNYHRFSLLPWSWIGRNFPSFGNEKLGRLGKCALRSRKSSGCSMDIFLANARDHGSIHSCFDRHQFVPLHLVSVARVARCWSHSIVPLFTWLVIWNVFGWINEAWWSIATLGHQHELHLSVRFPSWWRLDVAHRFFLKSSQRILVSE